MKKIPTFCLTHMDPLVKLDEADYLIKPKRVDLSGNFKSLEISGICEEDDLVLSDYAMISALSKMTDLYETFEFISILHYRRFCSGLVLGKQSKNLPYARVLSRDEYNASLPQMLAELNEMSNKRKALVCRPVSVISLAAHYSRHHIPEDFSMFVLTLREVLGWSIQECKKFSTFGYLIPAPNVGVFHVSFFKNLAKEISEISRYFYLNCYTQRDGYQRRSLGFLMERFFSYRLINEYTENNKEKFITGNSYIIVDDGDYRRSE